MALKVSEAKLRINIEGIEKLDKLEKQIKELSESFNKFRPLTKKNSDEFKKFAQSINEVAKLNPKTINQFKLKSQILNNLRKDVDVNTKEFKELGVAIAANERMLKSFNSTATSTTGALGRVGKGIKGVVGGIGKNLGAGLGASFLGPEAAIGGLLGGLQGVAIGAGIGQARRQIQETVGGIAEYSAKLKLAKTALGAASRNQEEYNTGLATARKISQDYTIDLLDTLDGYSKIAAAARANNLTLEETEDVFRGVMSAGVAFGGSQADLQALIRATTQVLSKGKVSAEEMQGQIGERLPGAVAKFAQATGRSLPQLSKAFEQGEVTIADFVKFSQKQVKDYDEVAKLIGASPEKAGARLKLALDTAKENYGGFFQGIGAGFQDLITNMVMFVNENQAIIKEIVFRIVRVTKDLVFIINEQFGSLFRSVLGTFKLIFEGILALMKKLEEAISTSRLRLELLEIKKQVNEKDESHLNEENLLRMANTQIREEENIGAFDLLNPKKSREFSRKVRERFRKLMELQIAQYNPEFLFGRENEFEEFLDKFNTDPNNIKFGSDDGAISPMDDLTNKLETLGVKGKKTYEGLIGGMQKFNDSVQSVAVSIADITANAFQKMEDALVNFVMTGKLNFSEFARSVIADLSRMIIKQMMFNALSGFMKFLNPSPTKGIDAKFGVLPNAKGNAFAMNNIVPYAKGGAFSGGQIYDKPTMFKYGAAGNLGVLGEAGSPEAILPLKRGRSGNLGVEVSGETGGNNVVNVSVDASGSSAQGNNMKANQLGKLIGSAIQAELVKQKRPGGILYE